MNHYLPNHVTIRMFAQRKSVYPHSVYSAIKNSKIIPDLVGEERAPLIDFAKYHAYQFQVRASDKTKVEAFYARKAKSFTKQGLPNPKQAKRLADMDKLPSVGYAIDPRLMTYPLTASGEIDLSKATKTPLVKHGPEWWDQLSAEDRQTVEYIQDRDRRRRRHGPRR